ncbi:MAG: WecB/TagA/CpsF family glycosyltransferase [Candidatus Saccharimonadales bacterium]
MTTAAQAPPRIRAFGVEIDALRMSQAVEQLLAWAERRGEGCRYVVTPNVDHVVLLQHHEGLRAAYAAADLVLADGAPLVAVARLLGRGLPERVAGSDLAPALFQAAQQRDLPLRVFLLGGEPGVADQAGRKIRDAWPPVEVVGTASPPRGFERDARQNAELLEAIRASAADMLLIGLGAPKQELWVHEHQRRIAAPVALCIGATIDFLAGHRRRAPRWMRRCGIEWLYRVAREPRRLGRRYLRDALIFPRLVWREARGRYAT